MLKCKNLYTLCLYSDIVLFIIVFHRQHQPHSTVFSSKLFVPVPARVLSTNNQPGCFQHLLNHPRWRILLSEWHPRSQPLMDHMWTLCTVPSNKQPGYMTEPFCSFSLQVMKLFAHYYTALSLLQITTKTGGKQLKATLCMCLVSVDLFFWLWTPFYCQGETETTFLSLNTVYKKLFYCLSCTVQQCLCCRGLLSARSLLGSIERAEDKLSLGLVASYLFKRIKRYCMFIISPNESVTVFLMALKRSLLEALYCMVHDLKPVM